MILRGTLIAALLAVELAILGEAVVALHGGKGLQASGQRTGAGTASGPRLVEGGPHRIFDAGPHPSLTIDIGYADLTILAGRASHIDVSVRASTTYGAFRATAPISARKDGETIVIATPERHGWTMGDDRMVTVLVPSDARITVANAGDIKANGLRAEASFKTIGNGSVTVEDYDARALLVAASNGRIVLHRIVAVRLDATSSDGRVEGTALRVRDGSIESNGRVTLGFAAGADTRVTAQTDNGRIRLLGFAESAASATTRNGSENGDDSSSSRTVNAGAGSGRLNVHTSDGNITLAQET